MAQLLSLANEGVFPITRDAEGQLLPHLPATGMTHPGTVQGEGKLAGVPSLFVRLASCNLRCIWQLPDGSYSRCDTPYASFDTREILSVGPQHVKQLVAHNLGQVRHVVLTGGEPLLQKGALSELARMLKEELGLHLTMETNGTAYYEPLAKHIDLFSISPKLENSTPNSAKLAALGLQTSGPLSFHGQRRRNIEVLQNYIDFCRATNKDLQLKFVVARASEEEEIKRDFLDQLRHLQASDVMLMPLGASMEELQQTTPLVLDMAIRNGWRFTPRVHIELFGSKPGV